MSNGWSFETRQIHAGQSPDPTTGARALPIYQTTSYAFRDTEHAANLFGLKEFGNIYTRIMNPTNDVIEQRLASLEGGVAALLLASGSAATTLAIFNVAETGDHVVSSPSLYGGTYNLFHYTLPKLGIEVSFVEDPDDADSWHAADPTEHQGVLRRDDLQPEAGRARHRGRRRRRARERRPVDRRQHRADAVPDPSARMGSRRRRALCDEVPRWSRHLSRRRDRRRRNVRLRKRAGPVPRASTCPTRATTASRSRRILVSAVPSARTSRSSSKRASSCSATSAPPHRRSTHSCIAQGLETLSLRIERHVSNALAVATWLEARDEVESVAYAGLESSPWYALGQKYAPKGAGAVLAFEIKGGVEAGKRFVDALELHSHVANIGDVRSLVIHPASTTHSQLTEEEQRATGVTPGLVRLAVGLEHVDDIIADLDAGFRAAKTD